MERKRKPSEIISEIHGLLGELSKALGSKVHPTTLVKATKPQVFSGPSGGIRLLLSEGFFKEPKTLPQVCARLKQEGFNYSRQVTSVALLRLVRDRTMVRLPSSGEGKETWVYAARK